MRRTMRDKNVWVFNAGHAFAGNPKWLFLYLQKHHPEITCHWLCYRRELVTKMRALGYSACLFKSAEARKIGAQAGVYVVDQNKEKFQNYLDGITVLNLWHGVTVKKLEQAVTEGFLEEGIAKKHIRNQPVYRSQLMLVTSPEQERIFKDHCRLTESQIIRGPYPNCFETCQAHTFDHDFLAAKGLTPTTKAAVYAPTFRDFDKSAFFSKAIPDIDALIARLETHDWLLIVKTHPQMEGDYQLKTLKQHYGSHPRLLFWDNSNDFYEVIDCIDMAIVDYSSIFFDMLARGVKRFVRYAFDYDDKDHLRDFAFDYQNVTCGTLCTDFESLLNQFALDEETDPAERERVFEWAWAYADDHSVEDIVQKALSYNPPAPELPTLYSFDVFDTLLERSSGAPSSVFKYVQDKMRTSSLLFPEYLVDRYVEARTQAESSCRRMVEKTPALHEQGRNEITFDMIFERLSATYELNPDQVKALKQWELECELAVSRGIPSRIAEVTALIEQGQTVLLISDMYLPEDFVRTLLGNADERLAKLPLFLSSSTGRRKTKGGLFLDAFHAIDYRYATWIHTGDNRLADAKAPKKLGIQGQIVEHTREPMPYADDMSRTIGTFDAQLVGTLMTNLQQDCTNDSERFACSYAALFFVPYLYWVIDHAASQHYECLYFIARDGYHLQRIADAIITERGLDLQTRYLYGSRKAWRAPAQIERIDDDFFGPYGNFTGVFDYGSLLDAALLDAAEFNELFPGLAHLDTQSQFTKQDRLRIVEVLRDSPEYRARLLERAGKARGIVTDYLLQEIDFTQKFAFVEYWARGYTQSCLTKLLHECDASVNQSAFYYAHSIYPTQDGCIRYNLVDNPKPALFAEALFANVPYGSTKGYRRESGRIVPLFDYNECDTQLLEALEKQLPRFAREFTRLDFANPQRTMRDLLNFSIEYFAAHQADRAFLNHIAPLKYSNAMNGDLDEFAPRLSMKWALGRLKHKGVTTSSPKMTIARANPLARLAIAWYESSKR